LTEIEFIGEGDEDSEAAALYDMGGDEAVESPADVDMSHYDMGNDEDDEDAVAEDAGENEASEPSGFGFDEADIQLGSEEDTDFGSDLYGNTDALMEGLAEQGGRLSVLGYHCNHVYVDALCILSEAIGEQHVGRRVTVEGYDVPGTLRYYGQHAVKGGLRCGVELDEAMGKNNGTVKVCLSTHS
jgi:hypothetical protein